MNELPEDVHALLAELAGDHDIEFLRRDAEGRKGSGDLNEEFLSNLALRARELLDKYKRPLFEASGGASDLEQLVPALALVHDFRTALHDDDFELLVPESLLMGVSRAWGYEVRHIPGIDCVYVAKRTEVRKEPLL